MSTLPSHFPKELAVGIYTRDARAANMWNSVVNAAKQLNFREDIIFVIFHESPTVNKNFMKK